MRVSTIVFLFSFFSFRKLWDADVFLLQDTSWQISINETHEIWQSNNWYFWRKIINRHLSVLHSERFRCIRYPSVHIRFAFAHHTFYPVEFLWWIGLPGLQQMLNAQVKDTKLKLKIPLQRRLMNKTDDGRIWNTHWRAFNR